MNTHNNNYNNFINSPLKEGKDIEIINKSSNSPHSAADSDHHGKVTLMNNNTNQLSQNEHLNDINPEVDHQNLPMKGGEYDTVSDETVTENGEESDESFEDEKVGFLNPSDGQFPVSTLLSELQSQHQEILQEIISQYSNTFRSCCQLPPTDSSVSNDAQTSSSLHASLSPSITSKGLDGVETDSKIESIKHKSPSKTCSQRDSINLSPFPESYENASGFLKELLKSYYLQKLNSNKSTREASTSGVNTGNQSEDKSVKSSKQKKSINKRKGVGLYAIMLALLCFVSSFFIGQLFQLQEELNLKNIKLNQNLKLNQEYLEKNNQLELKNTILKQLAEKAVEEEKRNCDFFDIFSILKNTLGSKKQHNIQELCSHYQRYQQLEAHLTQIIEKPNNPEELTLQTSIEEVLSSVQLPLKNQIDQLIPEELISEYEDSCPKKQLPEESEYGSVVSDPTPDKSIFKRFLGFIDTFRERIVKKEVSITDQESPPSHE